MPAAFRSLLVKDGNTLQPLGGVQVRVNDSPAGETGPDGTLMFEAAYNAAFVLTVIHGDFRADLYFDEEYDLVETELEIDGPVIEESVATPG